MSTLIAVIIAVFLTATLYETKQVLYGMHYLTEAHVSKLCTECLIARCVTDAQWDRGTFWFVLHVARISLSWPSFRAGQVLEAVGWWPRTEHDARCALAPYTVTPTN